MSVILSPDRLGGQAHGDEADHSDGLESPFSQLPQRPALPTPADQISRIEARAASQSPIRRELRKDDDIVVRGYLERRLYEKGSVEHTICEIIAERDNGRRRIRERPVA